MTTTSAVLFTSDDSSSALATLEDANGSALVTSEQAQEFQAERDWASVYSGAGFIPAVGANVDLAGQLAGAQLDHLVEVTELFHVYKGSTLTAETLTKVGRKSPLKATRDTVTGKIFGVCRDVYSPIQAQDIASCLSPLVDSGLGKWDGVLRLRNGAVGVVRMKLAGDPMRVKGDPSPIDKYLSVVFSHDLSILPAFYESMIRAVCENTLRAGLFEAKKSGRIFKIKHTGKAPEKIEAARAALNLAALKFQAFETWANRLAEMPVSDRQFSSFVEHMLPSKSETVSPQLVTARTKLQDVYASATQNGIRGTAWGAYQAATEYADHFTRIQGGPAERADSILFGRASDMKEDAEGYWDGVLEGELVI